jgi:hypothetical protein
MEFAARLFQPPPGYPDTKTMRTALAIASHYAQHTGDPEPYLERIAAAFSA